VGPICPLVVVLSIDSVVATMDGMIAAEIAAVVLEAVKDLEPGKL
jgi:hypothetical protein